MRYDRTYRICICVYILKEFLHRLPSGSLGLLRVVDTHKRRGLGSLMVRYLSKKISELGDEVRAPVVTENTPSRKMFEKLGFQQIDHVYWTW